MKHRTKTRTSARYLNQPVYPNAADSNYFTAKAMEILTAVLSGTGCMAAMIFLVMMA